jgi:predicted pyridoxine 5'-phosphate oxidase superfamily flavin-nucleotide-binding protein
MPSFSDRIESIDELRELIPPPAAPSVAKEVDRLDGHCRDVIARSPFLVVERCFLHCAKALRRSRLWEPETWVPRDELPSGARIFADHIALPGVDEAAAAAHLEEDYRSGLWPR